MFDQISEYVKALRSYGHPLVIAPKEVVCPIQAEHLE
jgi:hypothetical protein